MPALRINIPTAGSAVQFPAGFAKTLVLQGDPDNDGPVTVAPSIGVIGTLDNHKGLVLLPERIVRLRDDGPQGINLSKWYADAENNDDNVIGFYDPID